MPQFHPVARVTDIAPGQGRPWVVAGREIAVFNLEGEFYAIENTCPHRGGSLGHGLLDGEEVICPWHQWRFNVKTGRMQLGGGVEAFRVRVEGQTLWVEV